MKKNVIITTILVLFMSTTFAQNKTKNEYIQLETNKNGTGPMFEIEFQKGKEFYYPLFVFWIEDLEGNYIQTLYVSQSIATGVFNYGKVKDDKWVKEGKRRPAALPYWAHKRGVKAKDGLFIPTPDEPIADAYTGETPQSNFILTTRADQELPEKFNVLFEINQSWDWNEYWTNNKYPEDEDYKTSSQPALIYSTSIDLNSDIQDYSFELIGHSHYSGKTGSIYKDLTTITTAKEIVNKTTLSIKK